MKGAEEESAALTPYLLPGVLLASLNFIVVVGHTIQKFAEESLKAKGWEIFSRADSSGPSTL